QERDRAGGDHLGGGAAQPQEVGQFTVSVGAHYQKIGTLVFGIAEQRSATATAAQRVEFCRVDGGRDTPSAEIAQQQRGRDFVRLGVGHQQGHLGGLGEKGQRRADGARGLA